MTVQNAPASGSGRVRPRIADILGRGVYAQYANKHRAIFIHVPKTGGVSVARALFGVNGFGHTSYREYLGANPRKFRNFFKFSFVRNPWDRLVSSYHYLKSGGMHEDDARWSQQHLMPYQSFTDFVTNGLSKSSILDGVHFRNQCHFLVDPTGKIMVDYVGRFEILPQDFDYIARRLNVAAELETSNTSDHAHYTRYYTNETAEIVGNVYARDVEKFGYKYGD